MALHFFQFNGTDSREMHIRVPDRIPIIRPEERVEHVIIPGRSGELTQTQGDDIYNSYIQTVRITVLGRQYIPQVVAWLRGEGWVTFDSQPTRKQMARVINAITFEQHSRNLDLWHGDVQFYCDPVKRNVSESSSIIITESGAQLSNPGNMRALPLITVVGSGRVTIRMGGKSLVIPELTSGWVVDSENKWILNNNKPVANSWSGSCPELAVGNNTVQWTGSITQLTITPRFRYL